MLQRLLPKLLLWVAFILPASRLLYAQTTVSGTVTDAVTHLPLASVSIQFKGSRQGTTSGPDGKFTLSSNDRFSFVQFSYIGYKTTLVSITAGRSQTIEVIMEAGENSSNVNVKPHKVKYRNKDNPAVELIQKVIEHKDQNRMNGFDDVQYRQYEKMQVAISNVPEKLSKSKLLRRYRFIMNDKDTTQLSQGRSTVPVYLEETISQIYLRKKPSGKKQIVQAQKKVDFGEYLDNDGVKTYLNYLYQDVDVYENNIFLLTNQFISPVAGVAPTFYKYTIMDTIRATNGDRLVKLNYTPRNAADLLFRGTLYITLDGTYAIQNIELTVSKNANLNWVREMHITQAFEKDSASGRYHLSNSDVSADFGLSKNKKRGGLYGERNVYFENFTAGQPLPDSVFEGDAVVTLPQTAATDSFLISNRADTLTTAEAKVYKNMDSLIHMRSFKLAMEVATVLLSGYIKAGPLEIGPLSTFNSFNPVEGMRIRFGGRTRIAPYFSDKLRLEDYGAYGMKDQLWKYYGAITYSITGRNIYQFPVKYLRASFLRDTRIPGQELQSIQEDNFLLSFKRGVNDKWLYNDIFKLEWFNEMRSHFGFAIGYKNWKQEAAGGLTYSKQVNGIATRIHHLITSEIYTELRWAPGEQFYQGRYFRTLLVNNKPIYRLRLAAGFKGFGGEYTYQSAQLSVEKRFMLSQLGYVDAIFESGVTLGRVPYPILTIHRANQTYAYQLASFNMMNFLEFVSDHYASANLDYKLNGFLLNKIPLVKKLKLREAFSFKILAGGIRRENNPALHPDLIAFSTNNGIPATYTFNGQPYLEGSVGLMNIFKIVRADLVRRFTYLDHPNVAKWGIRTRIRFDL